MKAQLTGQPAAEIFPESETEFFYKVVDAQLDFTTDAQGDATSVTLYQNGQEVAMPRIDNAAAAQIEAALAAKVQGQIPHPGSEAALQRLIAGIAAGAPHYDEMSPELAELMRQQLPNLKAMVDNLGPVRTFEFRGVSPMGWDLYEVGHDKGLINWRVHIAADGKIDGASIAGL